MATPTPATRFVAHAAVGAGASYVTHVVTKKLVGANGILVLLVGAVIGIWFHAMLDAPLAKAMVSVGIQF